MTKKTFNTGDILVLTPKTRRFAAKAGARAQVTDKGTYRNRWGETVVDVRWLDESGFHQSPGDYRVEDFKLVEPSAKEPTAPMTKEVLSLLREKGALTSLEAQGVLRCRQLPARILELKRLGHKIVTENKKDATGQRYARYHLQAA
nr:helix-turn-helix domain-containing protein [Mesorhizobium loti]